MRYVFISWVCGILYWILDGIIIWNPYAQKLYQPYRKNAKMTFSLPKSFFVYLVYGFAMAVTLQVITGGNRSGERNKFRLDGMVFSRLNGYPVAMDVFHRTFKNIGV